MSVKISRSAQETFEFGKNFAADLRAGSVLAMVGNLGCGKTQFVKGLAFGLGIEPSQVRSPTFALVQEHRGPLGLCHADLYRLSGEEIFELGLEEYWTQAYWVVAVEWADKARDFFPPQTQWLYFESLDKNVRKIRIG